ncbi:hypothetical protein FLCU109888_00130 [Flavobacterium cucumis]|uniref:Lipoprotein n=1 Tax=Flavobacterium cucumis TaxID=416016 RepID=A0A1M7ZU72_9FLAO|nr:hypothetical protein [Flavobacterium cucumis]SHO72412.1 hypothetical protein SAMN05443547_0743 [Flavobacterium cucumis]
MQKLILLTFFSFFIISCTEKEKTYEELEAEVLCDVLPQLAHEFITTKLPPPPPPEEDYDKYNYKPLSIEDFKKLREIQKDSIKLLAKEKHKLIIGINYNLFEINGKELDIKKKFFIDSQVQRKFKINELEKSNLKFKYFEPDSIRLKGEFINDEGVSSLISISRVLFNSSKNESFFELFPFGYMPSKIVIISKKENNRWVVKEIIEQ